MKDNFVTDLAKVLKEYGIIEEMEYSYDGLDEKIIIVKDGTTRVVNVTYDSMQAMVRDVVKQGGLD